MRAPSSTLVRFRTYFEPAGAGLIVDIQIEGNSLTVRSER
jgi:hypothetical protein